MQPLAEEKKNQNIAEYILYMWQMEDIARAASFNPEILDRFAESYSAEPERLDMEKRWLRKLSAELDTVKLRRQGHVAEVREVMVELVYLHQTLINVYEDAAYITLYLEAKPFLGEYLQKAGTTFGSEVEAYLTALYGLMILRLRKTPISTETEEAMNSFSRIVGKLAGEYKRMKTGERHMNLN
jgi:hypothetical protein